MTNIATKNGSIIVKDGSVGTDCGCCGEWYCYDSRCQCPASSITGVSVVATASNHLRHSRHISQDGKTWYHSRLMLGAAVNGTTTLSKSGSYWQSSDSQGLSNAGGCVYCTGNKFGLSPSLSGWVLTVCVYYAYVYRYFAGTPVSPYLAKGNPIPGTPFVFGEGPSFGSADTYDPYSPNADRLIAWNTSAACYFWAATCGDNGWSWTPATPSSVSYGIDLGNHTLIAVDNEEGSGSLVLNEVSITQ